MSRRPTADEREAAVGLPATLPIRTLSRRRFVASLPALAGAPYLGSLLGGSLAATLAGCSSEVRSGPGPIVWDRDGCERCGMAISERRFAAEIRDPMKKLHKFDDFGCAVSWREHQTFSDAEIEFWVADSAQAAAVPGEVKWLDARQAAYVGGKHTPMAYGYAAVAAGTAGAVPFADARRAVLAKER